MMRLSAKIGLASLTVALLAPQLRAQTSLAEAQDQYTIPEGTEFKLQLHSTIDSKSSHKGDVVFTTLLDPVYVEDRLVLPKGIRIDGHINEIKAARRRGKGGSLYVLFDTLEMPGGQKVSIMGSLTEVFSSEGKSGSTVDAEGDLKAGGPSRKEQAAIFAVPTAGAALGAGLGPGIATAVGSAVAAYVLPKGKQAKLMAGSLVGMRLDEDVTLTLPAPKNPNAY